jgi:aldose sugar dehydrogenase
MAFLPDGQMLVTQRPGTMVLVSADGATQRTITGTPAVVYDVQAQDGLLDVAIDPDYGNSASTRWVYLTYSEAGVGGSGTALGRGLLDVANNRLTNWTVLWSQAPKMQRGNHLGSRIAFRPDKTLYITAGDREEGSTTATNHPLKLDNGMGKVLRLNRDGSIPAGNPATFGTNAQGTPIAGLWSIGHRNPQGAAVRPGSSDLWVAEHGPRGGDEVNHVLPGNSYGWPAKSYGCPYDQSNPDCPIGGGTHAPAYVEPKSTWVPSTAPSNLMFYTGDKFPEWSGNLFMGALGGNTMWRLTVDANNAVTAREEVAAVKATNQRIRNVEQGPDGWIYLLTDQGRLMRLDR